MKNILFILFISISIVYPQQNDPWEKWSWLIGTWTGEGSGKPGMGSGEFSLVPDLDKKVLIRKNHSEYPAAKDKPEIIHDDLMIVYLDDKQNPDKAIYFDNENHVINYNISYSENTITLTSIKSDEMPVFRLTNYLLDKDTVNVKFEMSQTGETFQTYTEGKCIRKK
jgi:hypothetical protein